MAVSAESNPPETRAIAIASLCQAIATYSQLRAKGSLIDSDTYKMFEGVLAKVESIFGRIYLTAQEARKLVALVNQGSAIGPCL